MEVAAPIDCEPPVGLGYAPPQPRDRARGAVRRSCRGASWCQKGGRHIARRNRPRDGSDRLSAARSARPRFLVAGRLAAQYLMVSVSNRGRLDARRDRPPPVPKVGLPRARHSRKALCVLRGTEGSNPSPSSGESPANPNFLEAGAEEFQRSCSRAGSACPDEGPSGQETPKQFSRLRPQCLRGRQAVADCDTRHRTGSGATTTDETNSTRAHHREVGGAKPF